MGLTAQQATDTLKSMLPQIKKHFTNNKPLEVFDCEIVAELRHNDPELEPLGHAEATLGTNAQGKGIVCCNTKLLALPNATSVKFGLGHELGHAFKGVLLEKLGFKGIDGPRTEVMADLGAAFLLTEIGVSWDDVIKAVKDWNKPANGGIFTAGWSGDHPPAPARVAYVEALRAKMEVQGKTFEAASKEMMTKLAAYKKNDAKAPEAHDPWEKPQLRFPSRVEWRHARDSAGVAKGLVKASIGDLLDEVNAFFQTGDNAKLDEKLAKLRQKDANAYKAKFADKMTKLYVGLGEYGAKLKSQNKEKRFQDYVEAIRRLVLVCASGGKDHGNVLRDSILAVDKDADKAIKEIQKSMGLKV